MKKFIQKNVLFIACLFLFSTSCKKDNDGPGIDAGSGKVTASIDGTSWESKDEIDGAVFASTQGTNIIQAYGSDGSYFGMTLFGNLSSGLTLSTTDGLFQPQYKPDFNENESYSGLGNLGSGTTTITSYSSSNITGTFEFTGGNVNPDGSISQKVISSGTYNIDF
ncbi:MAG: hypothetical protein AB8F94_00715 [Saprospiraceae bacterium]